MGQGDPTTQWEGERLWHASWTPEGPASLCFSPASAHGAPAVQVHAYGDGAGYALEEAGGLLGEDDDGEWAAGTPLEKAVRRGGGARVAKGLSVADITLRVVFGQRVTDLEANSGYRSLVHDHGRL